MQIIETIIKKDRVYAKIQRDNGSVYTMPKANFVWLNGNPGFREIPKGYVIHHLDHNKINDDISNLAIMQKYHHIAHHWKQKNIETPIRFEEDDVKFYCPTRKPRIYQDSKSKKFYIQFMERNGFGSTKVVKIFSKNKNTFFTRESAQEYADEIVELNKQRTLGDCQISKTKVVEIKAQCL